VEQKDDDTCERKSCEHFDFHGAYRDGFALQFKPRIQTRAAARTLKD
jgi:hypothetical protein